MRWLIRMSQWSRNPPSPRMVMLVLGVIAACLALAALEYVFGWPAWLTPQPLRLPR